MSYIRLAIVLVILLAFAGLGAAMFKYRGDAIAAKAEAASAADALLAAQAVNDVNQKVIQRLGEQIARNDKIVSDLNGKVRQINSALIFSNKALSDLKASHDDVRAYLDTPVPDALRRLYAPKAANHGSH